MAEVCRLILSRDKFNSNEIDGKAALLYASEYDYPHVIRELSFKGLNPNQLMTRVKRPCFMLTRTAVSVA